MHKRSQSIMATTSHSQRITRLKSREISVKAIPERKLKPRKAVVTNKSSKKINMSTRNKSLHVSKRNVSLRNNQTSLRRLRPRRIKKNYCEDSRLLQQFISPKQQDSVVIIEKLEENLRDKKVPVYKAVESSEKSSENKKDVYDFKFDLNDTKEKAPKKKLKKRNVNKQKGKTTKKTTCKKVTAKTIGREIIRSKTDANLSPEIVQNDSSLESVVATTSTNRDNMKKIKTLKTDKDIQTLKKIINNNIEKETKPSRIDADNQTIEILTNETGNNMEVSRVDINIQEETTLPGTFAKQVRKENTSKPRIISVENANNIIVTTSPPNKTEDTRPFRPKNIFDNKTLSKEHNSTLKSSLLMKTLSPILKTTNAFDFGSPWRPPTLTFSQTKHFIQSTPYNNCETKKGNKEIKKKSMEPNKRNMEPNKENIESNKENMETDKENISQRDKGRRKKIVNPRKKHAIQKKLPISENQTPKKLQMAIASKFVVQPAPARISLGEIKNLLLRPNNNVNEDNKQTVEPAHTEVNELLVEQKKKQLVDILNFTDTFDVLSDSEKQSNIGNDVPLFMDLEPSHFSKPPQHSYRRKRAVKFDFSEDSSDEEKENVKLKPKKKKLTKSEKEQEKKINEWIETVNSTFQEIEKYDLLIE